MWTDMHIGQKQTITTIIIAKIVARASLNL